MIELVIATENLHKIREFREMLKPLMGMDILSLKNFPDYKQPEETGSTFKENAELKALHAAKTLGKFVIADDSGLVVPALDGVPGVFSRRFAGENATDADNRKKLLEILKGKTGEARAAYFECALAVASPEGLLKSVIGRCEGILVEEERGGKGFGYDSLFVKYDYDKTFAELEEGVKNRISHRRKAFDAIVGYLESLGRP